MTKHTLPDTHQTFWQLAAIQLSGWMSLPLLATSVLILQENNIYGAALTIIVANAILWFIRLAIILMSYKKRQSTLDISRDYLGVTGSYVVGFMLLVTTLAWFIAQTTAATQALTHLVSIYEDGAIDQFTQMSVLLGVISTLLCMDGIVVLRKLTTYCLPLLLIALIGALFTLPIHLPPPTNAPLSLSGLALVLGANLGLTSDLPTFFRHSKSLQTSITSITFIQLFSLALALAGLFLGSLITGAFEINHTILQGPGTTILRISLITLIFLSVICANVANVYSASVGWEVLAPKELLGRKEYLILGLGLTTIFVLVSNTFSIEALLHASDSSMVNLCVILTIGYLLCRLTKRLPNALERNAYFLAWFAATIVNTLQACHLLWDNFSPLTTGIATMISILFASYLLLALTKRAKTWIRT